MVWIVWCGVHCLVWYTQFGVVYTVWCGVQSQKAGASVDGELTLNENLADNGGLTAAYLALDRLLQVKAVCV